MHPGCFVRYLIRLPKLKGLFHIAVSLQDTNTNKKQCGNVRKIKRDA